MDSFHHYHYGTFHMSHSFLYQMVHLDLVYSHYHNMLRWLMVLQQIHIDAERKSLPRGIDTARDCRYLREEATRELQTHIRGRLPFEYKICSQGLQEVLKYAWSLLLQDDSRASKIATLSLIAQCYKDRLEIATNASVVTEALQQVEKMKQQILGTDTVKMQSDDNRS